MEENLTYWSRGKWPGVSLETGEWPLSPRWNFQKWSKNTMSCKGFQQMISSVFKFFKRLNMHFRFLSESFSFLPDSMLPFFCGSSVTCRTLADAKALNISLQRWLNWWRIFLPEHPYILHPHIVAWTSFIPFLNRLHSDFTVVSVLEQLEVGLEVLECLLPSYFKVEQVAMLNHIVYNLTLLWPCKPLLF